MADLTYKLHSKNRGNQWLIEYASDAGQDFIVQTFGMMANPILDEMGLFHLIAICSERELELVKIEDGQDPQEQRA